MVPGEDVKITEGYPDGMDPANVENNEMSENMQATADPEDITGAFTDDNFRAVVRLDASGYTVAKNGDFSASIKGQGTYEFINSSKMNTLSKKNLQTIDVKKASKTVKKSKTVKMALKNSRNCSAPSQLRAKIHWKLPSAMGFLPYVSGFCHILWQNTSRNSGD